MASLLSPRPRSNHISRSPVNVRSARGTQQRLGRERGVSSYEIKKRSVRLVCARGNWVTGRTHNPTARAIAAALPSCSSVPMCEPHSRLCQHRASIGPSRMAIAPHDPLAVSLLQRHHLALANTSAARAGRPKPLNPPQGSRTEVWFRRRHRRRRDGGGCSLRRVLLRCR